MQIEKYDRKPFSVMAVQITFANVYEVAKWCKGTIVEQKTKMLGVDTAIPSISLEGSGESRGKPVIASLGCYIVELNGSFRVYKPASFTATFEPSVDDVHVEHLIEDTDDCVECTNDAEHQKHLSQIA
jgi:hypothetical protein